MQEFHSEHHQCSYFSRDTENAMNGKPIYSTISCSTSSFGVLPKTNIVHMPCHTLLLKLGIVCIYNSWMIALLCTQIVLVFYCTHSIFSVRCIHRTNRRVNAMMFVHLSVSLSIRDGPKGMRCDHTVHFDADVSSGLNSSMSWAPWHQSIPIYSKPSFSSSTWKRGGVWVCKLGEALNANNDK